MKFRPCIDIHNGRVKQIVGSSLADRGDRAEENYVSEHGADWYARKFRADGLSGGHVIMLNRASSEYFAATRAEALAALSVWPGGLEIGGGIRADNAREYLDAGASRVIVTSYVFRDGRISCENLSALGEAVGPEKIVLDLSCRQRERGGPHLIMTDRWQKYTDTALTPEIMDGLAAHCGEFLVHGIGAEGLEGGIDLGLVRILAAYVRSSDSPLPVTYAGGIRNAEDIRAIGEAGDGRIDFTVGSALDLYGGTLSYDSLRERYAENS